MVTAMKRSGRQRGGAVGRCQQTLHAGRCRLADNGQDRHRAGGWGRYGFGAGHRALFQSGNEQLHGSPAAHGQRWGALRLSLRRLACQMSQLPEHLSQQMVVPRNVHARLFYFLRAAGSRNCFPLS